MKQLNFFKNNPIRKSKNALLNILTYLFSSIAVIALISLIVYVFNTGGYLIRPKLFTSDYTKKVYSLSLDINDTYALGDFTDPKISDSYFSSEWGISLRDGKDTEGNSKIDIVFVDKKSPFKTSLLDYNTNEDVSVELTNAVLSGLIAFKEDGSVFIIRSIDGAEEVALDLDQAVSFTRFQTTTEGGGIRGSLLETLAVIGLTLIIALPLGIITAIYLNEYAKKNKRMRLLRSMIDLTAGIPSIIFGLVGGVIFFRFTGGKNFVTGSLTLVLILLPTIIKTTEEALKVIPDSLRNSSLALGASKTETVFKIVLPNAVPGILTATFLSIGRIIGESAALIFVMGTAIKDNFTATEGSTTLAVHIWTAMVSEKPNYDLSSAIAIIILSVVFILNIGIKIVSNKLNKFKLTE